MLKAYIIMLYQIYFIYECIYIKIHDIQKNVVLFFLFDRRLDHNELTSIPSFGDAAATVVTLFL